MLGDDREHTDERAPERGSDECAGSSSGEHSATAARVEEAHCNATVPDGYVTIATTATELAGFPTGLRVTIDDRSIAMFAHRNQFYAIDADCPHQGAGLELGDIEDATASGPCVACPRHGWLFELATGYCEDILDYAVRAYDVIRLPDDRLCVSYAPKAARGP